VRRRRRGEPEPAGAIISRLERALGIDTDAAALVRDRDLWSAVVGDDLAAVCRPIRLSEGTLVVGVADPVSETKVRYSAGAVRALVNEHVGRELVQTVVVRRRG